MLALPDDVLVIIFSHFDERQRMLAVAPVCKTWNHIVASTITHFTITKTGSRINVISSYLRSISMPADLPLSAFQSTFLNVESLTLTTPGHEISSSADYRAPTRTLPPPVLPHLRSLSMSYLGPCQRMYDILEQHCSQLTQLTFADAPGQDYTRIRFSVLRSLTWRGGRDGSSSAAIASASSSLTYLCVQGNLRVMFFDVLPHVRYTSLATLRLHGDVHGEHAPLITSQCPALRDLMLAQSNRFANVNLVAFAPLLVELDLSHNWSNVSVYYTSGALAQCSRLSKMVFNSGYLRDEHASQQWARLVRPCMTRLLDVEVPLRMYAISCLIYPY